MKNSPMLLVCVLALFALLLAAPGAGAAPFTVNSSGDGADTNTGDGVCDASPDAGAQCTLRAAVGQANALAGGDSIGFDAALVGQTIAISQLIEISPQVNNPQAISIDGCSSAPSSALPCVGLHAAANPGRFTALSMISAPDSTIRGLAITGAEQGIFNSFFSPRLTLRNNWFGLRIDGTTLARNNTGVTLTGDGAVVGGANAGDRNVFVGDNTGFGTGIAVNGSSDQAIRGNYIGVMPNGFTPAGLGAGIRSDGVASAPGRLTVGGRLSAAGRLTTQCDDACNVISANSTGIDLGGESANSKATITATIAGNHIGVTASGDAVPATAGGRGGPGSVGIDIHHADGVTIGGSDFLGDRNVITADGTAILGWAGSQVEDLRVLNNYLGTNASGTAALGQLQGGGAWLDSNTAKPLHFAQNLVAIGQVFGLDLEGRNASVSGNLVGIGPSGEDISVPASGSSGIRLTGASGDAALGGNVLSTNTIGNAGLAGILIDGSDRNQVIGNQIGTDRGSDEGNGSFGVLLAASQLTPDLNVLGGDTTGQGNRISNNPKAAIAMFGGSGNRVGLTEGASNGAAEPGGGFIDLGGDGPGNAADGPNDGVQTPQIVAAGTQAIFGTATPGATIRVYSKSSAEPGEVAGLRVLVTPVADDGTWKGTYPDSTRPSAGQVVAVTQTLQGGSTSEMSGPATTQPSTGSAAPPDTSITGPAITNDATPAFSFASTKAEGGYLCGVDTEALRACTDPHGIGTPLAEGEHVIMAAAVDPDGIRDDSPAEHRFTVDLTPPGAPALTAGPASATNDPTPTWGFAGELGATFACAIDGAAPVACDSGSFTPEIALAEGAHTFSVVQTDAAGNAGPPAARGFRIDTLPPQTRILKAPPKRVDGRPGARVKFRFRSSEPASKFQCRLDRKPWRKCRSPRALNLRPGRHVIRIRALDAAGNIDPTPAKRVVRVA